MTNYLFASTTGNEVYSFDTIDCFLTTLFNDLVRIENVNEVITKLVEKEVLEETDELTTMDEFVLSEELIKAIGVALLSDPPPQSH